MAADGNWLPKTVADGGSALEASMPAMAQLGILPDFGTLSIIPDGKGAVPFTMSYAVAAASVPVTTGGSVAFWAFAGVIAPAALTNQFGYAGDSSTITFLVRDVSLVMQETTNISTGTYTVAQIELLFAAYWLTFGQGQNTKWISANDCGRLGSVDVAAISTTNATEIALQHRKDGAFSDRGVYHADGTGIPLRNTNDRANATLYCGNTHGITILAGSIWRILVRGIAWNANYPGFESPGGSANPCGPASSGGLREEVQRRLQRSLSQRMMARLQG